MKKGCCALPAEVMLTEWLVDEHAWGTGLERAPEEATTSRMPGDRRGIARSGLSTRRLVLHARRRVARMMLRGTGRHSSTARSLFSMQPGPGRRGLRPCVALPVRRDIVAACRPTLMPMLLNICDRRAGTTRVDRRFSLLGRTLGGVWADDVGVAGALSAVSRR